MKRVLVLAPSFPFPIRGAEQLRLVHICRELAKDFNVDLLSLCRTTEELQIAVPKNLFDQVFRISWPSWRSFIRAGTSILSGIPFQLASAYAAPFRNQLAEIIDDYNLIFGHFVQAGQYVYGYDELPKILDMTDALSLNSQRISNALAWYQLGRFLPKVILHRLECNRLYQYEKELCSDFDLISVVSKVDRAYLVKGDKDIKGLVQIFPNGVDLDSFPCIGPGKDPSIVFIGNMEKLHNIDACRFFISQVLPLLKKEVPELNLLIIGNASRKMMRYFNSFEGVRATGRVEDIAALARGAFCGVCPMRITAGIHNKVLEYFALGLPAVVSDVGIEGINACPFKEFLSGNTAIEIAASILQLYREETLGQELAQAARELVERHYTWDKVLSPLREKVKVLCEG